MPFIGAMQYIPAIKHIHNFTAVAHSGTIIAAIIAWSVMACKPIPGLTNCHVKQPQDQSLATAQLLGTEWVLFFINPLITKQKQKPETICATRILMRYQWDNFGTFLGYFITLQNAQATHYQLLAKTNIPFRRFYASCDITAGTLTFYSSGKVPWGFGVL